MMASPALHLAPAFTAARGAPRRLVAASRRLPAARTSLVARSAAEARSITNPCLEIKSQRCAPMDYGDDNGAGAAAHEVDPIAHLWPWGDYFPGGPEFAEEDLFAVQERFSRESKEARAALVGEVAGFFRPLLDNLDHLRSLKTRFDTEDYHIGMPFGALIASMGCYHLWKMNPSLFLDAALGYAFYRLSFVSLQLRKQGFSNDLITRVKAAILVVMAVNDFKNKLCPLDAIRAPVYFLYLLTFLYEVSGLKKYIKYAIAGVYCMLQCHEGRRVLGDALSKLVSQSVTSRE